MSSIIKTEAKSATNGHTIWDSMGGASQPRPRKTRLIGRNQSTIQCIYLNMNSYRGGNALKKFRLSSDAAIGR